MRRRRTDFPRFRGNVNDVDVIFGGLLRHSALVEFRAVSTWYDHIYYSNWFLFFAVKVKWINDNTWAWDRLPWSSPTLIPRRPRDYMHSVLILIPEPGIGCRGARQHWSLGDRGLYAFCVNINTWAWDRLPWSSPTLIPRRPRTICILC